MPCVVKIGDAPVITGYVDRYIPSFNRSGHGIVATGRSKCQDLVDCSAEWPNGQISGASAAEIAGKLASAYGIGVRCDVQGLRTIPQFNILLGETAFEIIDRISKYSALLAYDNEMGDLVLSRVGTKMHASGFFEGLNVEAATAEFSADQCFQTYKCYLTSINVLGGDNDTSGNLIETVRDPGVKRNRKRYIIAEAVPDFVNLARQRAIWEMNRRNGRSRVARVVVDSWFDSAGELWTPNRLAPVYLPSLKISDGDGPLFWIIAEVSYLRGQRGTQAEILLMAPEAFEVAPMPLNYGFVDGATVQGYGEWDDECGTDVQDGPPAAVLGRASQGHHLR